MSNLPFDAFPSAERIVANHTTMSELVDHAHSLAARGQWEQSAVWLQIAATFGWFNHSGLFAHPGLEGQLVQLSEVVQRRATRGRKPFPTANGSARRRVLHVATQLYSTGGHTQMVSRWVAEDHESESALVVTRQGPAPVPLKISAQFPTGSDVLDLRHNHLITRAVALRRAAENADLVVIHAHPDDIVPALAFAASSIPSVVVDHADHVYWAGVSAAKTGLHMRHSGRDLAVRRRGLPIERALLMNRPLDLADLESRDAARGHWGIEPNEVLIVTAAAASKYVPIDDTSLVELLVEASHRHPHLRVLAAGPEDAGAWSAATEATDGAIRALGRVEGVGSLLAAADIYVDSFPFSSLTSLLEAGTYALPAVSFRGHPDECAVLGADSPEVDAAILYPATPESFQATIDRLVRDETYRRTQGTDLQRLIAATHELSWTADLERLYALAASQTTSPNLAALSAQPATGPLDLAVEQIQARTGFARGREGALMKSLSLLPLMERLRAFRQARAAGGEPQLSELLPPTVRNLLGRLRRIGS